MFSVTLKNLRERRGVSQAELGRALGLGQSAVGNWETGRTRPTARTMANIAAYFNVSMDYLNGMSSEPAPARPVAVRVPVLGNVAAGIPIEAVTDIVDYEEIDAAQARTGDFFGLRIKGSSMEPRIREGDVVIVRKQETADTGDTVVVLVNGDSATVKKIKYTPRGITLISNNPMYDPMFFSAEEVERLPVRILGRVVELRGKF